MSKCLIEQSSLTAIGDAVRNKTGSTEKYTIPEGLVNAIKNIGTGVSGDMQIRQFTYTKEDNDNGVEYPWYIELPSDPNKLGVAIAAITVNRLASSVSASESFSEQIVFIVNEGGLYKAKWFGHKNAEGFYGIYNPIDNLNVQNEFMMVNHGPSEENEGYDRYKIAMNYNGYGYIQSETKGFMYLESIPDYWIYEIVYELEGDYEEGTLPKEDFDGDGVYEDCEQLAKYGIRRLVVDDSFRLRGLFAVEVV